MKLSKIVEKRTKELKESYYIKNIKNNSHLMVISFILASLCVMISYPGILYSDSYGRVESAYKIKELFENSLVGQANGFSMWLTPTPSYFIALCLKLTGNIAFYTMCQAFAFFCSSLFLIKKIAHKHKFIQYGLFIVNPMFFCVSTYYEAGIGSLCGIVILLLLLFADIDINNKLDKWLTIFLLILSSFIAFGYRANAFTIIPALALIILLCHKKLIIKFLYSASIFIGLFLVFLIPRWIGIDTMSSGSAGFVWEIVSMIQNMEWDKQAEYIDYLDAIGGEGSTEYAIKISNKENICACLTGGLNSGTISAGENSKEIFKKYINMALNETSIFLTTKLEFISATLGIKEPLGVWEWDYNRAELMNEFNFSDTVQRHCFVNIYSSFLEKVNILRKPWLMFLLSLGILVLKSIIIPVKNENKARNNKVSIEDYIFLVAFFYYAAFLINNQSMEFRYFYPSGYLLLISDTALLIELISTLGVKAVVRLNKGEKNEISNI